MKRVFCIMSKMAYKYGIEGAGLPSYHYTHEMEVPTELIEMINSDDENKVRLGIKRNKMK